MEKEISGFIRTWNDNIEKVNGSNHSYYSLIKFCFNSCLDVFKSFNLKKIVININKERDKYSQEIFSFIDFEKSLYFLYHQEKVINNLSDRKFIYEGQESRGYELVFNRQIIIKNNSVTIINSSQKEIDLEIVREYIGKNINYEDAFSLNYSAYEKETFLFYQLSLYEFSTYRIKKWYNILLKLVKEKENIDSKYIIFLNHIYLFFKDYNKLFSEQERVEFWYKSLKKNKKFECFWRRFNYVT